jgi:hypothetical protein
MAQMEQPERLRGDRHVTVDDVRQLMGSSTPHFALQLRERIRRLIVPLGADDPARRLGELEIARLTRLAVTGQVAGEGFQDGQRPLPSLGEDEPTPVLGPAAAARGVPGEQPTGHDATSSNVG